VVKGHFDNALALTGYVEIMCLDINILLSITSAYEDNEVEGNWLLTLC
jgi:hypothetical protein